MSLVFSSVGFRYPGASCPLFRGLSLTFPPGWTGVVGANGSGKTTLLRLALGDLIPQEGSVTARGRRSLCVQGTETPPEGLEELLGPLPEAARLRETLGLDPTWRGRWDRLSQGERKRLQVGAALRSSSSTRRAMVGSRWMRPWASTSSTLRTPRARAVSYQRSGPAISKAWAAASAVVASSCRTVTRRAPVAGQPVRGSRMW